MSHLRFFVFLSVLCSCTLLGQGEVVKPETELLNVSPVAPKFVSSESPTLKVETSPTAAPVTTDAPSSSPSPAPNTTSTTTTTTTKAPTTTPTPTPAPAPTPAPKPAPVPAPDLGTWAYKDENNVTCIVVQFAAQINFSYSQNVDNTTHIESVLLNVPVNVSEVAGNCNGSLQWLMLTWPSGVNGSTVPNSLRLNFIKNDTTKVYALNSLNVTLDAKIMVNTSTPGDSVQLSHSDGWQTPLGTSYRCTAPAQLNLTAEAGVLAATLVLSRVHEEAYRTAHDQGFSAARDCDGGDLSDTVPIAVGCGLAAMVLAVLVAYLVARRRASARGYLSM